LPGDRFGADWVSSTFKSHGITLSAIGKPKSDLYVELLLRIHSGEVELLDNPKLVSQLVNLERKTARGGKDSIDHPPGGHDDLANAAAGAIFLCAVQTLSFAGMMPSVFSRPHAFASDMEACAISDWPEIYAESTTANLDKARPKKIGTGS
jgi:hypothetical protein